MPCGHGQGASDESTETTRIEADSYCAPVLGLRYNEKDIHSARRPCAGSMPGRWELLARLVPTGRFTFNESQKRSEDLSFCDLVQCPVLFEASSAPFPICFRPRLA